MSLFVLKKLLSGSIPFISLFLITHMAFIQAAEDTNHCINSPGQQQLDSAKPSIIVIKEIQLQIDNIFDVNNPEESSALFMWANRLHFLTKEDVILKDLLFTEGDPLDWAQLKESERILRTRPYIWDSSIYVTNICDGQATVLVKTRDVWTLQPSIDYGRSGGKNEVAFSISDSSFLGSGRLVEISHSKGVDRSSYQLNYQDLHVFPDRWQLNMTYAENSDGYMQFLQFHRPFYSLEALWEANVFIQNRKKDDAVYFRGEIVDLFSHEERGFGVSGGFSKGNQDHFVNRLTYGYRYFEDKFFNTQRTDLNQARPNNRIYSYPWLGWEHLQDRFEILTNIRQINRSEDINLGWHIKASMGYSSDTWGGDLNRWVLNGSASKFYIDNHKNIWQWNSTLSGEYVDNAVENAIVQSNLNFYSHKQSWHRFYLGLKTAIAKDLYRDKQLTLGGDTGLRGYPLRYQTGDRRFLVSAEERFYFNGEYWHLFNLGAAVFIDSGRAWFAHQDNGAVDSGVLANVGLGLRLSSTRTGHNSVIHINLAKPIGSDGQIQGLQWTASLETEF